jgi:TetR/AcrR family transcriptional repressor of nem operon
MARIREFSTDIALNNAIELFWKYGYANTSMREMVKHTGVSHAGLYTAFGSKDELFIVALERYEARIFNHLFRALESPNASLRDIKKLFAFITEAGDNKYFKHGCFIANTALEFAGLSTPVNDILTRTFTRQVKAFEQALINSLANGSLKKGTNIAQTAALLTVLFYGCSTLTRMRAPKQATQDAISATLGAISLQT